MHLLVLSAFQQVKMTSNDSSFTLSQCTFWCSVLSDDGVGFSCSACHGVSMHLLVLSAFRQCYPRQRGNRTWSQCTFWCSVLSDTARPRFHPRGLLVSMHLLVLSAFRLEADGVTAWTVTTSQCTFWCSVLSDPAQIPLQGRLGDESQCTFWCSVLSDHPGRNGKPVVPRVSMHLLVLSAFRLYIPPFPTAHLVRVSMHLLVLSAFRRAD